jgi:hypothetical protein
MMASRSLSVDSSGNVYITTLATGPFSGRDMGFIKYDALWQPNRHSPIQRTWQLPMICRQTLAIGPGGEVYVAGTTFW